MIIKIWHGRTRSTVAERYRNYVISTCVNDLTAAKGNCGVQIWQKTQGEITHIWVVSSWIDYESIKAFAGNNLKRHVIMTKMRSIWRYLKQMFSILTPGSLMQ